MMKKNLKNYRNPRWGLISLLTLLLLLSVVLPQFIPTQAADVTDGLDVEIIAAYNLIVDSNVMSPSTKQPVVATVIGKFCNTHPTATMTNVVGYIGDFGGDGAGDYPDLGDGINSFTITDGSVSTTYEGVYEFKHLGGAADATRQIGTLAPGACSYQYWSFTYPKYATENGGSTDGIPSWGTSVKPGDDLYLDFDIWGTGQGATTNADDETWRMYLRNEISAMANKIEPNGNPGGRWFNTDTSTILPGETVVTNGILYRLGNINQGFDNDNSGTPDYNAWLQPFGDPTYDPSCFRLIGTTGVLTVTTTTGDIVIPINDNLYFTDLPPNNTNVVGKIYYEFLALGGACTIPITPYQEAASGFDNEKFNGDYGAGPEPVGSTEPEVTVTKSAPGSVAENVSFTYSIPFANTSTSATAGLTLSTGASVDMPMVVEDTVPDGLEYVCGSVASQTSLSSPNTATVYFSTDSGATWNTSEPGSCPGTNPTSTGPNGLIAIRWVLDAPLPKSPDAGSSGNIAGFQAFAPTNYVNNGGDPFVENCAEGKFGISSPAFVESCTVTMIEGTASIGDFVWRDDNGDGIKDAGEVGIENVQVWLYWDRNNDNQLDDDDVLVGTQDTLGMSEGNYDFTNLPAGEYLVKVDKLDADIDSVAAGYTLTTPEIFAVSLVDGQDYNDADFGFGPTLEIIKTLISTDPATQNEEVIFQILLRNTLPGDGTVSGFCTYKLYPDTINPTQSNTDPAPPTSGSGNSAWQNPTYSLGAPDNLYAETDLNNNADSIGLGGFVTSAQAGTITSVKLLANLQEIGEMQAGDDFAITVYRNDSADVNNPIFTYTGTDTFVNQVGSFYTLEETLVAPAGGWQWSDFGLQATTTQGSVLELLVAGSGTGSPGGRGDVALDAIAFVITTDQQCGGADETIDPLPMTDTFDNAALEFVSADPVESSVSSGTIHWANLGPLYPGGTRTITVTFKALANSGFTINSAIVDSAKFVTGRNTNDVSDDDSVSFVDDATIAGNVWAENGTTSAWNDPTGYDVSDTHIPNVTVNLFACVDQTNEDLIIDDGNMGNCAAENGKWKLVDTTTTDPVGDYSFVGLRPGFYNVKIDTSTLPANFTTNTAEPYPDNTTAPGGAECGTVTCDNQWFTEDSDLDNLNQLTAGEDVVDISFGYQNSGSDGAVTGYVWYDTNGDGSFDTLTEPGIPGVTVYLCDTGVTPCDSGNSLQSTTTDADGFYSFTAPSGSNYIVVVEQPGGTNQTGDPDETGVCATCDDTKASFPINQDEVAGPYNFGYVGTLGIGDTVFVDWNGNGAEETEEEGISGVRVELYLDTNRDGSLDAGDFLMGTQTTDASGYYTFTNQAGGGTMYIVNVVASTVPSNHALTADPSEGSTTCSVCDGKYPVTVNSTSVDNADFGYQPTGFSSIGDYIWEDVNGDGVQGATESGIENVTVILYQDQDGDGVIDPEDAIVGTTTTDSSGLYSFTDLAEGDYIVRVDPVEFGSGGTLEGYILTTTNDPPYDASQFSFEVSLGANEAFEDADFGFAEIKLGDTVWQDNNGDGIQDATEPGINGVTMLLYEDTNNDGQLDGGDQLIDSVATANVNGKDGQYFFLGIPEGNYIIQVDPNEFLAGGTLENYQLSGDPDVYNDTFPDSVSCLTTGAQGCDGLKPYDRYASTSPYDENPAVRAGTVELTADFGYLPNGTIGDTLWLDFDADGVRDVGEPGVVGVTLDLYDTLGYVSSTTTDANGNYIFNSLPDRTYEVRVNAGTLPAGLIQNYDKEGGNNCAGGCDNIGSATISLGSTVLDVDFGYIGDYSISGTVGYDPNEDTLVDDDTELIRYSGVNIYLWDCGADNTCGNSDDVFLGTTLTDGNGDYVFGGLPSGNYRVVINPGAIGLEGLSPTAMGSPTTQREPSIVGSDSVDNDFGFLSSIDFGDLPSGYDNTLAAKNGARHLISSNLYLGSTEPDNDANGQESSDAGLTNPAPLYNGDDHDAEGNDDDGVTRMPGLGGAINGGGWTDGTVSSLNGGSLNIQIGGTWSGVPQVFIDFDGDDATYTLTEVTLRDASGDPIAMPLAPNVTPYRVYFDVPGGTFPGGLQNNTIYIRVRLSSTGGLSAYGLASNGEVEDYQSNFGPNAVSLAGFSASTGGTPVWAVALIVLVVILVVGAAISSYRKREPNTTIHFQ